MAYLCLDKDYVMKTMQEANKRAIEEYGEEDGKNLLLWDFDGDKVDEIDGDEIELVNDCNPMGYISLTATIDIDAQMQLIQNAVNKLNKVKALLESLK
jgi:tagatose-1,6-bisphosphate aldolase